MRTRWQLISFISYSALRLEKRENSIIVSNIIINGTESFINDEIILCDELVLINKDGPQDNVEE